MIRVTVGGTDRNTLDGEGVKVTRRYNERTTASMTFASGFAPAPFNEVIVYKNDGTTAFFGGLVHDIAGARLGNEGPLVHSVECVDWWAYLDWTLVNGGYIGPSVNIQSSTAGNPSTFTTATAHNFVTGDTVVIYDHPGFTGSGYTVTVTGTTTFTVAVAAPGGGAAGYCARATSVSLKRVLSDLVVFYLATHGITLDAAQEDGPTGAHQGLQWKYKFASDVIRDLTSLTALGTGIGWVGRLSPTKVLRMVNPTLATPSAPYALLDAAEHNFRIKWTKTIGEYGNVVVLKCGADKTAEVTESITLTAAHITAGFVDVFASSTPTGGVTCTLNGVSKTIGGAGSQFLWTWNGGVDERGRVAPGTISPAPVAGDVLAVSFTAQYPFYRTQSAGGSPVVTRYYEYPDIVDPVAADAMLSGIISKVSVIPFEIEFDTRDEGFEPGQIVNINLTDLSLNVNGFIQEVSSEGKDGFWIHSVKVNTAAVGKTALDVFRSFQASGGGGAGTYSGGINTSVVISGAVATALGGATAQAITPNSGVYERVVNAVPFVAPAAMSATIRAELWSLLAGVQVTARLRDIDTGTTVATSSAVTSTTPVLQTFYATLVAGRRYELQLTSNTTGAEIYGIGSLQSV